MVVNEHRHKRIKEHRKVNHQVQRVANGVGDDYNDKGDKKRNVFVLVAVGAVNNRVNQKNQAKHDHCVAKGQVYVMERSEFARPIFDFGFGDDFCQVERMARPSVHYQ